MSNYDCTKDLAYDMRMDNTELRAEIKRLERQLDDVKQQHNEEKRRRIDAETRLSFANEKIRKLETPTVPVIVDIEADECECPYCNATLERDWWACAGCGRRIDWDNAAPEQEDENVIYQRWCDDHPDITYNEWKYGA